MSASSMASTISIFDRSFGDLEQTGACRLAATVWPGSMVRVSTTPSTGERITVRCRLSRAVSVDACCWVICVWAASTCARAWSRAARARSASLRATSCCVARRDLRV
jgi:hypothetical protein